MRDGKCRISCYAYASVALDFYFPFLNQHRVTFVVILMVYYFVVFRSDFLSLPFQAIECSLAGVRPAGKSDVQVFSSEII